MKLKIIGLLIGLPYKIEQVLNMYNNIIKISDNYRNIIDNIAECCNPILIGYGGSYAYGTNIETSDIDIRGIFLNSLDEFIGIKKDTEQIVKTVDDKDIVIYSIKKMFNLLLNCNPNVIEMLGLDYEDYLFISESGKEILDHSDIFLSQKAIYTFGNYAKSQLNRLVNKQGRLDNKLVSNETRSLSKAIQSIKKDNGIKNLKVEELNNEPYLYINEGMSINKFYTIAQNIMNVHDTYRKSVRNEKAIEHNKLNKHMMHLLRLYMMAIDILENHKIVTKRKREHLLLMDIRNGKYLAEDNKTVLPEFFDILNNYTAKFDYAVKNTNLPKEPDYQAVNDLLMSIVKKEYFTNYF